MRLIGLPTVVFRKSMDNKRYWPKVACELNSNQAAGVAIGLVWPDAPYEVYHAHQGVIGHVYANDANLHGFPRCQ